MDSAQHIVKLAQGDGATLTAVELVDRTMIELSLQNPAFAPVIRTAVIGQPDAVLLVEFSGSDKAALVRKLDQLVELMGDLGLPGSVVRMTDDAPQKNLWEVRKAGLNIMMSLKGDGKPVSFIEDCAVPLEHLAEYTDALTQVFRKHGTRGTWYAHASVGTLHVRPILDMRRRGRPRCAPSPRRRRPWCAYKGAYSGEHGDGLWRGEWIDWQFGPKINEAFARIKELFDPQRPAVPQAHRQSAAHGRHPADALFARPQGGRPADRAGLERLGRAERSRHRAHHTAPAPAATRRAASPRPWRCATTTATAASSTPAPCARATASRATKSTPRAAAPTRCASRCRGSWAGAARGFGQRQRPRADRFPRLGVRRQHDRHRRQRPAGAWDDAALEAVKDALDLCVSCKGCKRDCPTGVDMAKMKIEFLHHYKRARLHAEGQAGRPAAGLRRAGEPVRAGAEPAQQQSLDGAARRKAAGPLGAPQPAAWEARHFLQHAPVTATREQVLVAARPVVLFVDTFNGYFESINARAALKVLQAAGYTVHVATKLRPDGKHLCCGRTYLTSGMVDEAKAKAARGGGLAAAVRAEGHPHRRPGAVVPADAARRNAVHGPGRRRADGGPAGLAVGGVPGARGQGRPARRAEGQAATRWTSACCCTATATRRPSRP